MKCTRCAEELPGDGDYVICKAGCKGYYHFECTNVKESTYKKMTQKDKKEWKCTTCRATAKQHEAQNKNRKNSSADIAPGGSQGIKELNINDELIDERSLLIQLNNNVVKLTKNFNDITEEMKELKESVQFQSVKYDEILEEIRGLKELKANQVKFEDKLIKLEDRVNELEQYSRSRNLEIKGVQECANENLKQVIVNIGNKIGVGQTVESDIDIVHRVGNMNNKTPKDIIVQFKSRVCRNTFLIKRKERILSKDVTRGLEDSIVYINEHLTPYNKQLFWQTKIKSKEKDYKYVWSKDGKIFTRKRENERAFRIRNEDDLAKIV